jgi:tRNA dimethylallyltransferase
LVGVDSRLVPVICGPTGAGKSAIALWLAERAPTTIIAADSRQVYRGFDIGTSKPDAETRRMVPHRGIDVVEPITRYSAPAWAEAAERWIVETERTGRVPLIVGGTGLYLRALFAPFFSEPPIDPSRRRDLEPVLARMPLDELARWVRVLDPPRAHLGRTQLLRAVEVALLSGYRLSDLHRANARPARRAASYLLVDPGPALASQITDRLDAMLAGGWVDEVRRLMREVPGGAPAWKSTGYRSVRALVRGEIDLPRARDAILIETRQYAKRQRTWFRRQLPPERITHLDPTAADWRERAGEWWGTVAARGTEVA